MRRLTDPSLWARIEALTLDTAGAPHPYSVKLAEAEGWQQADADRVVAEYRRFLYLTQILNAEPAPGPAIDAAWKMHLTYSRSYWDDLVPEVLRRPLHRDAEAVRTFNARRAFHRAAAPAYAREFGEAAPRDIWQSPFQPGFTALLVMFFVTGFAVAFLGGFLAWVFSLISGQSIPFAAPFLIGWSLAFFSPLWAWLVARALPHLRSKKRPLPGTTEVGISLEVGRS